MGKKLSASEIDGVQYRRAKLWQIILYACNAFVGMTVYSCGKYRIWNRNGCNRGDSDRNSYFGRCDRSDVSIFI